MNLVTRVKQYSSTISDLQSATNSAVYAADLNVQTNFNISTRLDQLTEKLNHQGQCISKNRNKIGSLCSSLDQFSVVSETQFLSLKGQLQVLSESSNTERHPSLPLSSVEVVHAEQMVVIEGLWGKMKGLEQTLVTEQNSVKDLQDMVVDLSEKVDSSLGTALTSRSNTSGFVSGEHVNLSRERNLVHKGIEHSEKLIL